MLLALAHVTSGTLEAPVVTRTQDESMSRASFALETPRTCMRVWPQSSKMRLMGCGALRKRVPAFKANSTLRTWDSGQHIATTAWRLGLYEASDLDMVDDGHDKDIQARVTPSAYHAGSSRPRNIGRPEHAHQAILLCHDMRLLSEGSPPPQLFPCGYPRARRSWMLWGDPNQQAWSLYQGEGEG